MDPWIRSGSLFVVVTYNPHQISLRCACLFMRQALSETNASTAVLMRIDNPAAVHTELHILLLWVTSRSNPESCSAER